VTDAAVYKVQRVLPAFPLTRDTVPLSFVRCSNLDVLPFMRLPNATFSAGAIPAHDSRHHTARSVAARRAIVLTCQYCVYTLRVHLLSFVAPVAATRVCVTDTAFTVFTYAV